MTMKVISAVCGFALVLFVALFASVRLKDSPVGFGPFAVAIALAINGPLMLWAVSGMETALFSLLLTISVAALAGSLESSSKKLELLGFAFLLLASLTRPEGFLVAIAWAGLAFFRAREAKLSPVLGLLSGPGPLLFIAGTIATYAWKAWYYGAILPTSFIMKTSAPMGWDRILGGLVDVVFFIVDSTAVVLIVVIVMGLAKAGNPQTNPRFWFIAAVSILFTAYRASLGYLVVMDYAHRLIVPAAPLLALLVIEALRVADDDFSYGWKCIVFALSLVAIAIGFSTIYRMVNFDINLGQRNIHMAAKEVYPALKRAHIATGKWLAKNTPKDSAIVLWDAGAISYYSDRRVIDTWSLTDKNIIELRAKMAMAKSESEVLGLNRKLADYIMSLKPDYFIQVEPMLFKDNRFREFYRPLPRQRYVYIRDREQRLYPWIPPREWGLRSLTMLSNGYFRYKIQHNPYGYEAYEIYRRVDKLSEDK